MRADILDWLFDQRHQSGTPRIGAREVEIANKYGKAAWRILKALRVEGLIKRGSGFCWLTESSYEELLAQRASACKLSQSESP